MASPCIPTLSSIRFSDFVVSLVYMSFLAGYDLKQELSIDPYAYQIEDGQFVCPDGSPVQQPHLLDMSLEFYQRMRHLLLTRLSAAMGKLEVQLPMIQLPGWRSFPCDKLTPFVAASSAPLPSIWVGSCLLCRGTLAPVALRMDRHLRPACCRMPAGVSPPRGSRAYAV